MRCIYAVKATKNGHWYDYPCGQCAACRITRRQEWVFRLMLEMRLYDYCYFVTLTYDNDHLPDGLELVKEDVQNWLKRLRKRAAFRYFGCGEYGEKTLRPHYHFIIMGNDSYEIEFGIDPKFKTTIVSNSSFHKAWTIYNRLIGLVDVRIIPSRSDATRVAQYVAGYTLKKLELPSYENREQQPFLLMSRNPGIGFVAVDDIVSQLLKYNTLPKVINPTTDNFASIQMLRYNGRLWPVSRTFREHLIKACGGDPRSDKLKSIINNNRSKSDFIKQLEDPSYAESLKLHIEQVKCRAEKKVRFWKDAKRRNPGVNND